MTFRFALPLALLILMLLLAGCDSGTPATPTIGALATATAPSAPTSTQAAAMATPVPVATTTLETSGTSGINTPESSAGGVLTAVPVSSAPPEDTALVAQPTEPTELPAPTAVSATATGADVTALTALAQLKPKALAWQPDARLVMMANVRPGQADKLLGVALGDPNVNEPTPGGLGRDWALIVFSPSTKDSIVLTMDGTQTDLVQEGALTDNMVQGFSSPDMAALDLSSLDLSKLTDSDKLPAKAGATGQSPNAGIAMLAPDGLGLGPLPTPKAGGSSPKLAYELFSADPTQQNFLFFDAFTGEVVLDSTAP